MNKIYAVRIFADHYQFYIFDASEDPFGALLYWDDENTRKGYISNGRTIYLSTVAHLNEHWLEVYLSDSPLGFDDCERALSLNIKIASGELGIATPVDWIARINLKKGSYIAYVLAFNLGVDSFSIGDMPEDSLSDEKLEESTDKERYTIVLVPGSTQSEGVVKGKQYLY